MVDRTFSRVEVLRRLEGQLNFFKWNRVFFNIYDCRLSQGFFNDHSRLKFINGIKLNQLKM